MSIALHHLFLLTDPGAADATLISDLGLIEGPGNHHPGQGTANRRFFFANSMLEFLYLHNAAESDNGPARGLQFTRRYHDHRASPFGIIVERAGSENSDPFDGWKYYPEYFQNDQSFHVGANSAILEEPLIICMPENLPASPTHGALRNSDWKLTELIINVPVSQPSGPLQLLARCDNVSLKLNVPHQLTLVFNDHSDGRELDLTPRVPLVLRW